MPDDSSTSTQRLTSGESMVVEAFVQKYGQGHVLLACHVAFPMVLTADLVYKIWQNFQRYSDENGNVLEIPYIAVSDFLLSPLCQPSGYQRFEMPANIRRAMLEAPQDDPDFGKPRLQELAAFLKHYIESTYRDADAIGQAIRNAQQLMVDAWLEPEKALQTLTQAFLESEHAPSEQVRLGNLMEGFSLQWASGLMAEGRETPKHAQTVLRYSQGLSAFHKTGDAGHAADILKDIIQKGDSGLALPLPGAVKTTVSRRLSPPQKGKLFALIIALDEVHPSSKIAPLRGCKSDARQLANWVEATHKAENSPWSEIRVETLFDAQATFTILEKRAELLQEIGAEDHVLIYFAGHARVENPEDETDLIYYDGLLPNAQKLTVSRFRNLVLSNARQQPYITVVLDAEFTGYPNWLDPTNPKHVVFANTGLLENGYEMPNSGGFFSQYFIDALAQQGGRASNAALFVDTISGMAQDKLSEQQHPQFYATPLGAERPFLQAMDPVRALKRQLRLSGASLADLQKQLNLSETASKQQWQSSLTTFLAEKERTDAPLFLFVFSDADGDLPGVQQEMVQLKSLVEAQFQNTSIEAVILQNPDFKEVQQYFTTPEYRNRLHLFHFSGLDKENTPLFQPSSKMAMKKARPIQQQSNINSLSNIGDEPESTAQTGFLLADGLLTFFEFAPWLVYQQNLRLVFINSCFSNHSATWATQLGAWNAIGVEGEVSDSTATKFAVDFYSKWMVKGNALSAAFQEVLEASRNDAGPDAASAGHRSAQRKPPVEEIETPANVPFQLKTSSWLSTSWRGERFGDYHLIADSGLRALVFEYDTLDISDKKERVTKKMQLAQKMGEVINSVVADKRLLLGSHSSQGLLVGLVNAVRQRPSEADVTVLLDMAPMVEQLFVRYEWVATADGLMKEGMWPEERNGALEEVLKGFEEGADEDLRGRISSMKRNTLSALARLNDLIGLENVKQYINDQIDSIRNQKSNSKTAHSGPFHLVFIGNPGTGKTTVARLIADIYREEGILGSGHLITATRMDLVAGYVGQTTQKTEQLCRTALGGVLFIDEAYTLWHDENDVFGKEAVEALLLFMFNNQDKFCLILSGYTKEMEAFLEKNPGFERRITRVLDFPDYKPDELLRIFESYEREMGLKTNEAAKKSAANILDKMYTRRKEYFGNAREVKVLIERMAERFSKRCIDNNLDTTSAQMEVSDIPISYLTYIDPEIDSGQKLNPLFVIQMLLISGDSFTMGWLEGRDGARYSHEIPTREVRVNDFYISKYPVTQAEWRAVMGDNPSHFKADEQCPVEQVSWQDVQAFLKVLNEKTGKNYRLPTEAEWEYAARGGQNSKAYEYAGSNTLEAVAWYAANAGRKTKPVGQKTPNELGLYDMSGNVWEWVADDWHENYEGAPTDGSAWIDSPKRSSNKVCRGGSWNYQQEFARCALRYNFVATYRVNYLGFRLAHDLENF